MTAWKVAFPRLELHEAVRHDGLALRGGEQLVAQPDQTSRRDGKCQVHTVVERIHALHLTFSS